MTVEAKLDTLSIAVTELSNKVNALAKPEIDLTPVTTALTEIGGKLDTLIATVGTETAAEPATGA